MSEFSTNITIKGLKRDLFAVMIALQEYVKGINDISISCPWCSSVVNGKYNSLIIDEDTTSEEIASFAKELQEVATLDVEADGPWGCFGSLDEVNLFEDISIVAPSCHLKGWMGGIGPGGEDCYVDYDDDDGEEAVINPAACTEDEFGLAKLFDEKLTSPEQFREGINEVADRIRKELDWDPDECIVSYDFSTQKYTEDNESATEDNENSLFGDEDDELPDYSFEDLTVGKARCAFCDKLFDEEKLVKKLSPHGSICMICQSCCDEYNLSDWPTVKD